MLQLKRMISFSQATYYRTLGYCLLEFFTVLEKPTHALGLRPKFWLQLLCHERPWQHDNCAKYVQAALVRLSRAQKQLCNPFLAGTCHLS